MGGDTASQGREPPLQGPLARGTDSTGLPRASPAPESLLWLLSKRQLRLRRTLQCPALLPGLCPQARTGRAHGQAV